MANDTDILQIFSYLLDAYPSYEPKSPHPETPWMMHFSEVDPTVLQVAIDLHIVRSRYFPAISDIKDLLNGAEDLLNLQSRRMAPILQSIIADRSSILNLEQAAYAGHFDSHQWELLIADLNAHDHPHQAAALSRRLALRQSLA